MKYLTEKILRIAHNKLSARVTEEKSEPLPSFETASKDAIDALIKIPKTKFGGVELYPSIEEKAAIIFYTINKKHIFENGNKRMSVQSFLIFLQINNYRFDAPPDEVTAKALELALTTHENNFDQIKKGLSQWIASHMRKN